MVTVNVPGLPTVKVLAVALVMAGACKTGGMVCTVRVKFWTASGRVPFEAVMMSG